MSWFSDLLNPLRAATPPAVKAGLDFRAILANKLANALEVEAAILANAGATIGPANAQLKMVFHDQRNDAWKNRVMRVLWDVVPEGQEITEANRAIYRQRLMEIARGLKGATR